MRSLHVRLGLANPGQTANSIYALADSVLTINGGQAACLGS